MGFLLKMVLVPFIIDSDDLDYTLVQAERKTPVGASNHWLGGVSVRFGIVLKEEAQWRDDSLSASWRRFVPHMIRRR
jgi:hypothetical protein